MRPAVIAMPTNQNINVRFDVIIASPKKFKIIILGRSDMLTPMANFVKRVLERPIEKLIRSMGRSGIA